MRTTLGVSLVSIWSLMLSAVCARLLGFELPGLLLCLSPICRVVLCLASPGCLYPNLGSLGVHKKYLPTKPTS